jgi:hypothetical protein
MATLVELRELTTEERKELERLARSRTEEARLVVRAKIVLGLAAGERPYQVADRVGVGRMAAKGIGIKRTRIDEILIAEGLRRCKQETWVGQKVDPQFAAKRGRSRRSTPPRRKGRPSSASTRWDRKPPRVSRAPR